MMSSRSNLLIVFTGLFLAPQTSRAGYLLSLTLSPNVYNVSAGGEVTLRGFFTTADSLIFPYDSEYLFGFSPASPHLGIVAGSILYSQDFTPPYSVSFEDIIGGGGFLGPAEIVGPAVTTTSDLRTFVIPADTAPGVYYYSYGVYFSAPAPGTTLFDTSLTIIVTPEASPAILIPIGGLILASWSRRSRHTSSRLSARVGWQAADRRRCTGN